ncbi:MAG TPA: hypothetical protein VHG28_25070 [Longimicrobiaceae bacterium]|nr:hypothetical protein [Longimicrobiaceae bacterium]
MMDDLRPVDFGPLDPWKDPERYERMVQSVLRRASAELERRALRGEGPLAFLAGWMRPTLTAAAVVCAVSLGVMTWSRPGAEAAVPQRNVVDELGLGAPVSLLALEEQPPTSSDLLLAVEDPR